MTVSFIFLLIIAGNAQFDSASVILPLNTGRSMMFGQDIVIRNLPNQDQQNAAICSAPNGWLYNTYCFDSLGVHYAVIMRSKDNGYTWQLLKNIKYTGDSFIQRKLDIIVTGTSDTNQKLFFISLIRPVSWNGEIIDFLRFKCDPFTLEAGMLYEETQGSHDIAIAMDNDYPAAGSSPGSIGLLYSKSGIKDSLIFLSSGDGGQTFNNRRVVTVSTNKIHKVSLTFGRSASQNTGRYYAAWEEDASSAATLGNILTAHTTSNFTSPFTTPKKFSIMDPTLTNLCRNPKIACQANNIDNDSTDLSEVILFEKYNDATHDYDITGFYNKKAANGTSFTRLNVASTANNEIQPDILFNPNDSNFMVTYYDSTNQKLPLLKKNLNMENPNVWNIISPGYNDSYNLSTPNPKVSINLGLKQCVTVWTSNSADGKGVTMFDASYIPAVGIDEAGGFEQVHQVTTWPNPCTTAFQVSFELTRTESVNIKLYNLFGQPVGINTEQIFKMGLHVVRYDISALPAGTYLCTLSSNTMKSSSKILIIK